MAGWDALIRTHGAMVFRTAWRILRDVQEAEDVAQDVLLELSRTGQEPAEVAAGLLQCVTVRRALDRLRRRRPKVSANGLQLAGRSAGPEDEAIARELLERLHAAVAQLPARQAEVFCMRYLHDASYEAMAHGLGISREAVAVALHEARNRLRAALGEGGGP